MGESRQQEGEKLFKTNLEPDVDWLIASVNEVI